MYDTSHILEHHGVKGQKWGVRRYDELRTRGSEYIHKQQKEAHLAKKYERKAKFQQHINNHALINKKGKQISLAEHQNSAKEHAHKAEVFGRKADKAIRSAAKLPVKIERNEGAAIAKMIGSDVLNLNAAVIGGAAAGMTTSLATGSKGFGTAANWATFLGVATSHRYGTRTARDRFDEGVDDQQHKRR